MKTVKDYNLPPNSLKHKQQQHEKISTVLFYQVCADTVKAKHTRTWAQTMLLSWPLTFWPLKWCPSHVTWVTSVPILVFLGLSVLDLGPMYATDRHTSDSIITLCPRLLGAGNYNLYSHVVRQRFHIATEQAYTKQLELSWSDVSFHIVIHVAHCRCDAQVWCLCIRTL